MDVDNLVDFFIIDLSARELYSLISSKNPSNKIKIKFIDNVFVLTTSSETMNFEFEVEIPETVGWFYASIEINFDLLDLNLYNCIRNDGRVLPIENYWIKKIDNDLWSVNLVDYTNRIKLNYTYSLKFTEMNLYRPTFNKTLYEFKVKENNKINDSIGFVSASDLDINQQYKFRLINGSNILSLNENTGEIEMKLILDFELIKEIIVLLEVFDLDRQPVKTSSAILKIVVEDENDNTPFCFQNPIQFNLDTSVQNNTILFKIRANDADSSLNGLINYKLLNQSNNFKINETTGELVFLSSEKSIDYGITNLLVELIDNGIPTKTNTCLINIKVFSPNLHQPEILIENNQTVFYIPEDKSIGSKILFNTLYNS